MSKITVLKKVKSESEVEVEITLPYFTMGNCHAYKVIDKDTAICVNFIDHEDSYVLINLGVRLDNPMFAMNHPECNEEEFNTIYQSVMDKLDSYFEQSLQ